VTFSNPVQPAALFAPDPAGDDARAPALAAVHDLVLLAARLLDVSIAVLCSGERGDPQVLTQIGLPANTSVEQLRLCIRPITERAPQVIPNLLQIPALVSEPLVSAAEGIRFLARLPILDALGRRIATLSLMDRKERHLTTEQVESLQVVARQIEFRLRSADRTEAEQALKAEQQLNRQIVASSPIGIAIYDQVGNCITANEAMAIHVGCEQNQLLQQNFHRLASWQESGIYQLALKALTTGGRSAGVIRGTSSFGKSLWLSVDFSVLEAPSVGHLMLMTQDLSEFKRSEEARRETEERFEMLFINSLDGILFGRPDGTITAANPAACAMLGMSEAQVQARGRGGVLDLQDPRLGPMTEERRLTGRTRGELTVLRDDGSRFEAEFSSVLYPDSQGRMLSSSIMRDITQRRQLEARLEASLELLNRLAQRVPGVIYQYRLWPDGRSCFPFASEGIENIYEVTAAEVREDATPVYSRIHPDDVDAIAVSIQDSADTLLPWHQEYRVVLPRQGVRWRLGDAKPERLADGSTLWHGFITDITQRRRQEEQTYWLAFFDSLTSLPNRRLMVDRIGQALASARRHQQNGCLLFVDLDHFKRINDARGHAVGDTLLQQVAQRLTGVLRAQDTVARIGGDEFVLLVPDLGEDPEVASRSAMAVAEKVREVLDHPFDIDGQLYGSSGSIGITVFPKADESVEDLVREADTAMYRAKESGRNRISFYHADMQAEVEEALALENDLKEAITRSELLLHVQGQFDRDGSLAGAELLLRWQHPQRGMIPPGQFIPLAENTGLIARIGEWVLEQAARALARLAGCGSDLSLSINVSPLQILSEAFVDRVRNILLDTGAPAERLIFEVTEGLFIKNYALAVERMRDLMALGIRFSIDDFGTGYSSLSYLKSLPLNEIKIDRTFVQGIPDDADDIALVNMILVLSQHLGKRVVAEGVETAAQAEFLLNSGCDALQGFLLARPEPFEPWVTRQLALGYGEAAVGDAI
jgi:diguanylate cyclase (GGDEF)-like protein/PAS domain S-box-containing protein